MKLNELLWTEEELQKNKEFLKNTHYAISIFKDTKEEIKKCKDCLGLNRICNAHYGNLVITNDKNQEIVMPPIKEPFHS